MTEHKAWAVAEVAELFKVCGDATRAGIICELSEEELRVSDIAARLDMSSSAISHQLRILKHTRIVRSRREGKNVVYALDDQHIKQFFDLAFEHVLEGRENETA